MTNRVVEPLAHLTGDPPDALEYGTSPFTSAADDPEDGSNPGEGARHIRDTRERLDQLAVQVDTIAKALNNTTEPTEDDDLPVFATTGDVQNIQLKHLTGNISLSDNAPKNLYLPDSIALADYESMFISFRLSGDAGASTSIITLRPVIFVSRQVEDNHFDISSVDYSTGGDGEIDGNDIILYRGIVTSNHVDNFITIVIAPVSEGGYNNLSMSVREILLFPATDLEFTDTAPSE